MVVPVKYKTDAGSKLAFTTTIDLFRSKAQDSGEYDGQDEPEFIGTDSFEYDGEIIEHPVEAVVRVYRKGISRPFVGSAKWKEFYPGHRRGSMWRKMPETMLSKCAEAQGTRKGFPERLGKLYAVEEMEQAANQREPLRRNNHRGSPRTGRREGLPQSQSGTPSEAQRKAAGQISDGQIKRLFAIARTGKVSQEDVAAAIKAKWGHDHVWQISWRGGQNSQYNTLCNSLENEPDKLRGYAAKHRPAATDGEETFVSIATAKAIAAGIPQGQIQETLMAELSLDLSLEDVPEERQAEVIGLFDNMIDENSVPNE